MNKYRNNRAYGFDSKAEMRRWTILQQMEKDGCISQLQRQVKYQLIPAQRIHGKCVERACGYIADFTYLENGVLVVEDCKGFRTPEYIIKRKLMLYIHGIQIRETHDTRRNRKTKDSL